MSVAEIGAVCFGVVVGWIVYRTLRRNSENAKLSDIATVIGAVGGAAVTTAFNNQTLFGWYAIGLAGGFFIYLILGHTVMDKSSWLGGDNGE
jgi:O-antigen/teichoic acid export membrane protein